MLTPTPTHALLTCEPVFLAPSTMVEAFVRTSSAPTSNMDPPPSVRRAPSSTITLLTVVNFVSAAKVNVPESLTVTASNVCVTAGTYAFSYTNR